MYFLDAILLDLIEITPNEAFSLFLLQFGFRTTQPKKGNVDQSQTRVNLAPVICTKASSGCNMFTLALNAMHRPHRSFLILNIFIILADAQIFGRRPFIAEWFRITSLSSYNSPSSGDWLWGWIWGADGEVTIVERTPTISFDARPASFGPFLDDPILGYVIPMSSFTSPCQSEIYNQSGSPSTLISLEENHGCPDLCVIGPHEPEKTESWIALVQRGRCQFAHKVREAQRFGAKAVIVGGEDPELSGNPDALVHMYSPGTFICVTNFLVYHIIIA